MRLLAPLGLISVAALLSACASDPYPGYGEVARVLTDEAVRSVQVIPPPRPRPGVVVTPPAPRPGVVVTPPPGLANGEYCNSWNSATRSRFRHVITAPPGRARLTISASSDASGGETVAVYPEVNGERGRARVMFVIAHARGERVASGVVTIPRGVRRDSLGQFPIVVDVENAGGRRHAGRYCITAAPG